MYAYTVFVTYNKTVQERSHCWTVCIPISLAATHTHAVDDSGHNKYAWSRHLIQFPFSGETSPLCFDSTIISESCESLLHYVLGILHLYHVTLVTNRGTQLTLRPSTQLLYLKSDRGTQLIHVFRTPLDATDTLPFTDASGQLVRPVFSIEAVNSDTSILRCFSRIKKNSAWLDTASVRLWPNISDYTDVGFSWNLM
jgi:hypothetical protein